MLLRNPDRGKIVGGDTEARESRSEDKFTHRWVVHFLLLHALDNIGNSKQFFKRSFNF